MVAFPDQPVKTNITRANTSWEFVSQDATKADTSGANDYHANAYVFASRVAAYPWIEELEQSMRRNSLNDHDSMSSREAGSLAYSTSVDSAEADHGSVTVPLSTPSASSGVTISSLDSHDEASRCNCTNYPTAPTDHGLFRYDHTLLGGDVSQPSMLERWTATYERHERIAYQLEKPQGRKRKASGRGSRKSK